MRFGPLPRIMTFLRVGRARFVFRFVARIEIRREAFELGRAGIHAVEDRRDAQLLAAFADLERRAADGARNPLVGEAVALQPAGTRPS